MFSLSTTKLAIIAALIWTALLVTLLFASGIVRVYDGQNAGFTIGFGDHYVGCEIVGNVGCFTDSSD